MDKWVFYLLKAIISLNGGKIKMKNSHNYYHITMKTCLSPSEIRKCNCIVFVKKILFLERIFCAQMTAHTFKCI